MSNLLSEWEIELLGSEAVAQHYKNFLEIVAIEARGYGVKWGEDK